MTGQIVVHEPLSVPLRKRLTVLDADDNAGVIVGFRTQRTWSFRRVSSVTFALVEFKQGERSFRALPDLRVVEPAASNQHQEGQQL